MRITKLNKILIFLLASTTIFGQIKYEPQILILAPNEIKYEKSFDKEISKFNNEIREKIKNSQQEEVLNSPDFKNQPENIKIITKSEIEFSKNLDFFKQASIISEQILAYRFFEKFPNLLIKLKDSKSTETLDGLKKYSDNENLQYVLNFSTIELFKDKMISYAKVTIQLYDNFSNSILLNKSYIGDWNNPGFEFTCNDKSLNCTLNNALSQALDDVINTIASNSPTLKREKQLHQERFDILMSEYFKDSTGKESLKNIFPPTDKTINTDILYQTLFNADNTKFISFFLEQVSAKDLKTLTESKKDKNINIITDKDIKEEGYLSEMPKTYGYVIKGVKYNEKWYYEKSDVTYFDAKTLIEGQHIYFNNLQKWNFFKENSTNFNPEFWETNQFKKVPDLKKDPEWDKYGDSIWETEEANNRDYIGLYEIVANVMKNENSEQNSEFEKQFVEKIFKPNYELLKKKDPNQYSKISEHSLIYSKTRKVAVNPVLITDNKGIKTIHYFVALDNSKDFYEWIYFTPIQVKDDFFGNEVVEQISSLTDWNFSNDNLNDIIFWNNNVLLKTGNDYKYLKLMKQ
jgi:hypothetical protein